MESTITEFASRGYTIDTQPTVDNAGHLYELYGIILSVGISGYTLDTRLNILDNYSVVLRLMDSIAEHDSVKYGTKFAPRREYADIAREVANLGIRAEDIDRAPPSMLIVLNRLLSIALCERISRGDCERISKWLMKVVVKMNNFDAYRCACMIIDKANDQLEK